MIQFSMENFDFILQFNDSILIFYYDDVSFEEFLCVHICQALRTHQKMLLYIFGCH